MKMQRIQKLITFSPHLYELVEKKAKNLGVSFTEYIRMLAVSDIKKQVEELPMVDGETEKLIAQGMEDFKNGRYTALHTKEEIEKHFDSL